jgi:hypothetical protein
LIAAWETPSWICYHVAQIVQTNSAFLDCLPSLQHLQIGPDTEMLARRTLNAHEIFQASPLASPGTDLDRFAYPVN